MVLLWHNGPMRFTHNAILTGHVTELVAFYTSWCGMRLVKDRVAEEGRRVVWLAPSGRDDFVFVVIQTRPDYRDDATSAGIHYGFQLESRAAVNQLYFAMLEAAADLDGPPRYEGPVVGYIFMAKDPDGRWVEFNAEQHIESSEWQV